MPRPATDFVVKVKSRNPWRRVSAVVLIVSAINLGAWGAYELGRKKAGFDNSHAARELNDMRSQIQALEDDNEHLHERTAALQQGSKVDHYAYKDVSKSLKSLQDEIYELKEEVAFYRTILEPGQTDKGLRVQSLKVLPDGRHHQFRYKLVLTQVITNAQPVQGDVQVTVHGIKNGAQGTLSLNDLTTDGERNLHFRFKYFQKLEGVLTFPAGFTPTRVDLRVIPRGRSKEIVERTFDWTNIKT